MGVYLNPGSSKFRISLRSEIYVDKSALIGELNPVIDTENRFVCVSRPRRFGKTMAANMLAAYYGNSEDTDEIFTDLIISNNPSYKQHLNQHMVIQLNMQSFYSENDSVIEMLADLQAEVIDELKEIYPQIVKEIKSLPRAMEKIYAKTSQTFIILIDEWDCLFRVNKNDTDSQEKYLDFLRNWLKDKSYVGLAYMTGILPIKKYGTHSALNMFDEYSMISPGIMAEYAGFTEDETRELCGRYGMDFEEMKTWYNGYSLDAVLSVYSPQSVITSLLSKKYDMYWNRTETYEALKTYIQMNFDGLKDSVVEMLAGGNIRVNTTRFSNDMTTLVTKDDVLTLLVHLGYLGYNSFTNTVFIPNKEVSGEFVNAIEGAHWDEIMRSIKASEQLLQSLWNMDGEAVAAGVDNAHLSTSILQYNDENALSYTISLAFYSSREYYTTIRELPSGKGFADICFIPRPNHTDKPAIMIELKWDKAAIGAIAQIKNRKYVESLEAYWGNILLVGINYDKRKKTHECTIEKLMKD